MLAFIIRRLFFVIGIFFVLSYAIWLLTTSQGVAALHSFSFQNFLPGRYLIWLDHAIHGDLGYSINAKAPVLTAMVQRLPASLLLIIPSFILQEAIAFGFGLLAGSRYRSWFDRLFSGTMFTFAAIPPFWLALFAIVVIGVQLQWLPFLGLVDLRQAGTSFGTPEYGVYFQTHLGQAILDIARHLAMPVLVLALTNAAIDSQLVRLSLVEELKQDYIRAARARGLRQRTIVWGHALRNALIPLITNIGSQLPRLIFAAGIIEQVFSITGVGHLFFAAVYTPEGASGTHPPKDYDVVSAYLLVLGIVALLGTIVTDVAYAAANPRIREATAAPAIAENPLRSRRPIAHLGQVTVTAGHLSIATVAILASTLGFLTVRQLTMPKPTIAGTWYGPVTMIFNVTSVKEVGYMDIALDNSGAMTGTAQICEPNAQDANTPVFTKFTVRGSTDFAVSVQLTWNENRANGSELVLHGAFPQADKPMGLRGIQLPFSASTTMQMRRGSLTAFQDACLTLSATTSS